MEMGLDGWGARVELVEGGPMSRTVEMCAGGAGRCSVKASKPKWAVGRGLLREGRFWKKTVRSSAGGRVSKGPIV